MRPGNTTNADVMVPGARRGNFVDASLDKSSGALVLDCHAWSNDKVRVAMQNVSLSTMDSPAAALHVQAVKRRVG
jgi:hypothetical protein